MPLSFWQAAIVEPIDAVQSSTKHTSSLPRSTLRLFAVLVALERHLRHAGQQGHLRRRLGLFGRRLGRGRRCLSLPRTWGADASAYPFFSFDSVCVCANLPAFSAEPWSLVWSRGVAPIAPYPTSVVEPVTMISQNLPPAAEPISNRRVAIVTALRLCCRLRTNQQRAGTMVSPPVVPQPGACWRRLRAEVPISPQRYQGVRLNIAGSSVQTADLICVPAFITLG